MSIKRTAQSLLRTLRQTDRVAMIARDFVPVPPPFKTALFNFTIDFELAWGNGIENGVELPVKRRLAAARAQAENFGPFVELLKELGFPISWALLGKLADPNVVVDNSLKFKPIWAHDDWYSLPSEFDRSHHPGLWRGEAYLSALKRDLPFCEVLCHGYAHIDYADEATSEAVARNDVLISKAALERAGFKPAGFVFPCNHLAYPEVVRESGFQIARGAGKDWHARSDSLILTPIGFWASPGVMSFKEFRKLLNHAIEARAFVHPWMHLIECSLRNRDIQDFYRPIFEIVLEAQAKGLIENISFKKMADELTRDSVPFGTKRY